MAELRFESTRRFELTWNDKGTGLRKDGAFYRPIPGRGYAIVGDYGQSNYDDPVGSVITVAETHDPTNPPLRAPTGYDLIWKDTGSGAFSDGSFWRPHPPKGYVAIGSVCQSGYDPPRIPDYVCLREDLVTPGKLGDSIWTSCESSPTPGCVTVWQIERTGVIFATTVHSGVIGPIYEPKGL